MIKPTKKQTISMGNVILHRLRNMQSWHVDLMLKRYGSRDWGHKNYKEVHHTQMMTSPDTSAEGMAKRQGCYRDGFLEG